MKKERHDKDVDAIRISDGANILVYRINPGFPTPDHIWADSSDCKTTYKADELQFKK